MWARPPGRCCSCARWAARSGARWSGPCWPCDSPGRAARGRGHAGRRFRSAAERDGGAGRARGSGRSDRARRARRRVPSGVRGVRGVADGRMADRAGDARLAAALRCGHAEGYGALSFFSSSFKVPLRDPLTRYAQARPTAVRSECPLRTSEYVMVGLDPTIHAVPAAQALASQGRAAAKNLKPRSPNRSHAVRPVLSTAPSNEPNSRGPDPGIHAIRRLRPNDVTRARTIGAYADVSGVDGRVKPDHDDVGLTERLLPVRLSRKNIGYVMVGLDPTIHAAPAAQA